MGKVFEDEFMDLHSSIIDLCREFTRDRVDMIYAYCSIEDGAYSFNAFFTTNGKARSAWEMDISEEIRDAFFRIGIQETIKIGELCEEYGRPVPTQIKMIYDVKTKKFASEYQYKPMETMEIGTHDLFYGWVKEVDPTYK